MGSGIVAADKTLVALTDDPSLAAPVRRSLCQDCCAYTQHKTIALENRGLDYRAYYRVHARTVSPRREDREFHLLDHRRVRHR